ncbi:MAG TPA: DUF1800 domain-containing protein [Dehalococcoidia bacterium]|nr:DUF1800 domain-containing protein [Dehalococcoidia bacterium]
MADNDIALMAHLMRRAGFGSSYEELEQRVARGYEATVEELLHPEVQPDMEMDVMNRYMHGWRDMNGFMANQGYWTYRMVNSPRQLEEKVCLFWHGIFCVGDSKCMRARQILIELNNFRSHGLGKFDELLKYLATDPAMLYYLDNQLSHKEAVNENWGRELLELFSMGVGMDGHPNYTEDDVKACAQAFTGWTIANAIPRYPYGSYANRFLYNRYDHIDDDKTFLGETGNFNGDDIIRIIAKQPATARFIARHLSNYFVSDEPQVPAWQHVPPIHPELITELEDEYFRSGYEIRSMLRVLFNSDAFKNARFAKVKNPSEIVCGTLRVVGDFTEPKPRIYDPALEIRYMGQDLLNPPTVEGWHTGKEWIDSGTLVERVNFAAGEMGRVDSPGIQAIIHRLSSAGPSISAEQLVDGCLEALGCYQLGEDNRRLLLNHAQAAATLQTGTREFALSVGQMLQLIVSTQEYQFN